VKPIAAVITTYVKLVVTIGLAADAVQFWLIKGTAHFIPSSAF
jgi:hypothetical protein